MENFKDEIKIQPAKRGRKPKCSINGFLQIADLELDIQNLNNIVNSSIEEFKVNNEDLKVREIRYYLKPLQNKIYFLINNQHSFEKNI